MEHDKVLSWLILECHAFHILNNILRLNVDAEQTDTVLQINIGMYGLQFLYHSIAVTAIEVWLAIWKDGAVWWCKMK